MEEGPIDNSFDTLFKDAVEVSTILFDGILSFSWRVGGPKKKGTSPRNVRGETDTAGSVDLLLDGITGRLGPAIEVI